MSLEACFRLVILLAFVLPMASSVLAFDLPPLLADQPGAADVSLVDGNAVADVLVDPADATVTQLVAKCFAEDVARVTGCAPTVQTDPAKLGHTAVLIGTLDHCPAIDALVKDGKINVSKIRGQWEAALLATVEKPLPNVDRALVIVGSDRRGTAYGVFELSEQIGVSPWYWWADVPTAHRSTIAIKAGSAVLPPAAVKYRGIFINDEDWALRPWASETFEPEFGNIGPKTYAKVFELLLRLKANYLWPAMHPGSMEFGKVDANIKAADDWGIVMGASHAEPMNRNNVDWNKATQGEWRYDTNRDAIYAYWQQWAQRRGPYEAVWTVGLRGIHDAPMNGPKDNADRVKLLEKAITDERTILSKAIGKPADEIPQIFVPYKEVLPLYRAGLKVPDDVALVWPDDNYGYIRQLSTADEQKRGGGAGVYYHISYWGKPEDYLWINTTPPALIWEEMMRAYENGARNVWVLNVGDIKPGEIGMDYFLRLARCANQADQWPGQKVVLGDWAARTFGPQQAEAIAGVLDQYYRLNFVTKPEHLVAVQSGPSPIANPAERLAQFDDLVAKTNAIFDAAPAAQKDALFETVVYPIRCSALQNRKWLSTDPAVVADAEAQIHAQTQIYNDTIAGGKWKKMMSDAPRDRPAFRPVDKVKLPSPKAAAVSDNAIVLEAEKPSHQTAPSGYQWIVIDGLGTIGDSIALRPATPGDLSAASLQYDFTFPTAGPATVQVIALPTHQVHYGLSCRYTVTIDDGAAATIDLETRETSSQWSENVLHNTAIGTVKADLAAGKHTITLRPIDPGLVFDRLVITPQ